MTERTERVRVLHLITRFLNGGAERTTEHALAALHEADRPYDLRLGFGAAADRGRVSALPAYVDTVQFRSLRHYNPVAAVVAVGAVAAYLRRHDVDILHTHSTEAGIVGRVAAALAGTDHVIHEIHGDPIAPDRNATLNRFLLAAERATAPLADRLLVNSTRVRDAYLSRGIGRPEQYVYVPDSVNVERFRGAAFEGQRPDGPLFLFVGRLADGKGLFDLLDAVEAMREDHDVSLWIAGDGPLADDLDEVVQRRGLGDVVSRLGYREDVPELLAAADALVLPSYREGTPRVITEALAAGTPVVATDIAGIPEQVTEGETGYLVAPGDVGALADRLTRLVTDTDRREQMADRAPATVDRFDIRHTAAQYRDVYDALLGVSDQSGDRSSGNTSS